MNDNDIIGYDSQGWPIWKETFREFLEELGAEVYRDDKGNDILGFNNNSKILESYPTTLIDDGMGYGVDEMFITNADYNDKLDNLHIWRDYKRVKENEETN